MRSCQRPPGGSSNPPKPETEEDELSAWSSSPSSEDALCPPSSPPPGQSTSPSASKSARTRVVALPPHRPHRKRRTYQAIGQRRGHCTVVRHCTTMEKSPLRRIASPRRAITANTPVRSPGKTSPRACCNSKTNVGAPIALRSGPVYSASTDIGHTSRPIPGSIGHGNWLISNMSAC